MNIIAEMRRAGCTAGSILLMAFLYMGDADGAEPKEDKSCIRSGCHVDLLAGEFKHSAVEEGNCDTCHQIQKDGTPFQSGSRHRFTKVDQKQACGDCHEAAPGKSLHKPYVEANCTGCHNPHTAAHANLLKTSVDLLCASCHEKMTTPPSSMRSRHAATTLVKGCANCHSAHVSDQAHLLAKPEKELCLGCHNKEMFLLDRTLPNIEATLSAKDASIHDPVKESCTGCHNPHFGESLRLLSKSYGAGWYANPTLESYGLCFDCHDAAMLQKAETEDATAFRNGKKNLHVLHVLSEPRGRSCSTCHNVHASSEQHLMAQTVSFAGFSVPVKFEATKNGGSCAPGCHDVKSYSR